MPMMRIIVSGADQSGEHQFKRLIYYGPDTDTCRVVQELASIIGWHLTIRGIVGSFLVDAQVVDDWWNDWWKPDNTEEEA
jgi:hypothetical protein